MTTICSVGLDMIAIPAITPDSFIFGHDCRRSSYRRRYQQRQQQFGSFPYGKEGIMLELGGLGSAPV